jgi:hypothetical protein
LVGLVSVKQTPFVSPFRCHPVSLVSVEDFDKLTVAQAVKKLPVFYEAYVFVTEFKAKSNTKAISTVPTCFPDIYFIIICPAMPSSVRLDYSGCPTTILYAFIFSLMHATCPTYLVLDLVALTIFGKE